MCPINNLERTIYSHSRLPLQKWIKKQGMQNTSETLRPYSTKDGPPPAFTVENAALETIDDDLDADDEVIFASSYVPSRTRAMTRARTRASCHTSQH